MRTTHSCKVSKISAFIAVSFIAVTVSVAQTKDQGKNQDATTIPSKEVTEAETSNQSPSLLQKIEDMVGLRAKIERLKNMMENLEDDISKMRSLHDQVNNAIAKNDSISTSESTSISPQAPETVARSKPAEPPKPPAIPEAANADIVAELVSIDSFDVVASDSLEDKFAMPVLSGTTPDWVKNGLNGMVQGDEHSFAIGSTLLPDLEQCREDLKSKMMMDVRLYLEKNVLHYPNAKLPELTQEYVEKYWVKRGQLFDNVTDRPSGTYHQAWIGLHLSSEQIAKVREWEKQSERDLRIKKAGILGGASVFAVMLLSSAVGLLARREKAKLKA